MSARAAGLGKVCDRRQAPGGCGPRPGWPETLPCLGCGRRRTATRPADRLCEACRERAAVLDLTGAPRPGSGADEARLRIVVLGLPALIGMGPRRPH
jgi:hypothetical protein